MLYIEHISYYLPTNRVSIQNMKEHTNLSDNMLGIFEKIYGLKDILVENEKKILDILCLAISDLLHHTEINVNDIRYLIHSHTGNMLIPFGESLPQQIKVRFELINAIAFGTTMHKCMSSLKALEVLSVLINKSKKSYALLLTGEISFTKALRLIPKSSISGDAAAVALISNRGSHHQLLASETILLPGYSEGIYLSDEKLQQFDREFIPIMTKTILTAIHKAKIDLDSIALILPHNVNYLTWKNIAKALNISNDIIYFNNIAHFGHCFSSDGLLNLVFAIKENRIQKKNYYIMAGCGMGFFFSCSVFKY